MMNISWLTRTLALAIGSALLLSACLSNSPSYGPSDQPTTWGGISVGSGWGGWHSGLSSDVGYLSQ